jgi:hypothetical protein
VSTSQLSCYRADCAKCCGLCCVAPAFDAAQGFGYSKPACTACTHLRADFRCSIHDRLRPGGFPACITFDCYGAGQRVTQHLFAGKSWRSSPELASQMFNAYHRYRVAHETLAILELAIQHAAPPDTWLLRERLRFLDDLCASGEAASEDIPLYAIRAEVLSRVRDVFRSQGRPKLPGLVR